VSHAQVDSVPAGAQVVVCHQALVDRARGAAPEAVVIPFSLFMGDPALDRLEQALRDDAPVQA
jgi:galactose PTS system EIIB component